MNEHWTRGCQALAALDPVLAALIGRFPAPIPRHPSSVFETLARAITGQQISTKAADTIWSRLQATHALTPEAMLQIDPAILHCCGYSQRKTGYLIDLARHCASGTLDEARWQEAEDEAIIAQLTQVRGIGRWSAEMFLMFHLQRPDVFPLADLGLQRALMRHYPDLQQAPRRALEHQGERWRPWRSLATWYLWRSLDPVEVAY